jgi:hypothetical protein
LIAAPTRPSHFLLAILFYGLTWIAISYVFNVFGRRFGWSSWSNTPFTLSHTAVTAIFWGVGMVGLNRLLRKNETT